MADTTLATNWVMESLRRIAQEKEKKAADDARAQSRAYNNLVESMQIILGMEHTERILAAHEPTSSPANIRSGRFEFEGRADACGTGFYIACPDYTGANRYESGLKSGWIDSIADLDKAIDELSAEMQKRDEFVAARIEREALAEKQPQPERPALSPQDRLLISRLEVISKSLKTGGDAATDALTQATIYAMRSLYSMAEFISQATGNNPSEDEPPDGYDPDRDR